MGTLSTAGTAAQPAREPEDHRRILSRVGWVLIGAEGANLAYQLLGFFQGETLGFSADFLYLVAGIFLIRGSLPAARAVRWAAGFLVALEAALLAAVPFWAPPDYLRVLLRIRPRSVLVLAACALLFLLVNLWVSLELAKEPVRSKLALPESTQRIGWNWLAGLGTGALLAALVLGFQHGETGQLAVSKAREQNGTAYRYFVTSLSISSENGHRRVEATVVAFNDHEIRDCDLRWEE